MASRFWVGGTGTWDSSDTTHWAASSGAAGGQSVPGSADTVTFDGSSGGGTVTLNFGGTITIQSITMGAFTGTFENSVNNNNMTLSLSGSAFSGTGSGTRTVKLGTATYTLTGSAAVWNFTTVTNLTLTASSANIVFSGGNGLKRFIYGNSNITYGSLTLGASSAGGSYTTEGGGALTLGTLAITAPNYVLFSANGMTLTNAFNWAGTTSAQIFLATSTVGTQLAVTAAASSVANYVAFRDLTFTNTPVASNSFDLLNNSGITITPPSGRFVPINNPGLVR